MVFPSHHSGAADRSYGIHVAQLAGLPPPHHSSLKRFSKNWRHKAASRQACQPARRRLCN